MSRKVYSVLAALLVLLAGLGACARATPTPSGPTPTPATPAPTPAKERVVRIASTWMVTGPASDIGIHAIQGWRDFVDYVNEDLGGVSGARLELLWEDARYDVARETAAYERFKDRGAVAINIVSTPGNLGLINRFTQDQITSIPASLDPALIKDPGNYVFLTVLDYGHQGVALLNWMAQDWKAKGKTGNFKVGLIGWDNAYGRSVVPYLKAFAPQAGALIVEPFQWVPVGALEVASQVSALKGQSLDYVYAQVPTDVLAMVLKEAVRQGVREKITWTGNHWSLGEETVTLAGKDVAEGYVAILPYMVWEDSPRPAGLNIIETLQRKHRGEKGIDYNKQYIIGWLEALIAYNGVKWAIEDVGFDKLNGKAVKEALEKGRVVDTMGLMPGMKYTPDDHRGAVQTRTGAIKGGKIVAISDWYQVPFVKP